MNRRNKAARLCNNKSLELEINIPSKQDIIPPLDPKLRFRVHHLQHSTLTFGLDFVSLI